MMPVEFTYCKPVEHANLVEGWVCCKCRTYNMGVRASCIFCGHSRCEPPKKGHP